MLSRLPLRVEVRRDHIDAGFRCDASGCPVALAIEEQTGLDAQVCDDEIILTCFGHETAIPVCGDSPVRSFVPAFDAGQVVNSFGFTIYPDRVV